MRHRHRKSVGFTIVELLTVIAIIGILAALLLPVLINSETGARKVRAKTEIRELATAIQKYDSDYGRFPVSATAQTAAAGGDFTYGGSFTNAGGGATTIGTLAYPTNNAEVIAILMDFTNFPNTTVPTVNSNCVKNAQRYIYLDARLTDDPTLPGVGPDLVYRDPWGNPYVISMDLNDDGMCEDAFYGTNTVSSPGLNGLVKQPDGFYAVHSKVMIWSAGPDRMVDSGVPANIGANKDNVLSWAR